MQVRGDIPEIEILIKLHSALTLAVSLAVPYRLDHEQRPILDDRFRGEISFASTYAVTTFIAFALRLFLYP